MKALMLCLLLRLEEHNCDCMLVQGCISKLGSGMIDVVVKALVKHPGVDIQEVSAARETPRAGPAGNLAKEVFGIGFRKRRHCFGTVLC